MLVVFKSRLLNEVKMKFLYVPFDRRSSSDALELNSMQTGNYAVVYVVETQKLLPDMS